MIDFTAFTLDNGLRVLVHEDATTPLAAFNVLYDVGSRDENPDKTGFAHLFEHLMFGGSRHIPSYDEPLQRVGGENNAFTSPDITNYYITLPSANLETAFWLESDRMLSLSFDPEVLRVQRSVVIEEYKQNYLNQPYGDAMIKLKELAYRVHPYQWPTIGRHIAHIEEATLDDVRTFFYQHYVPNNAVLVVAGSVTVDQVKRLADRWFGPIPAGKRPPRQLPVEPRQSEKREQHVTGSVPADALYKAYHMPARLDGRYHTADLLSDVLERGKSSRLYTEVVKTNPLFSSINAYISGSADPGLLIIQGKVQQGIALEEANQAVEAVVEGLRSETVSNEELEKVKNQAESSLVFAEMELLNRAMNLAYATVLGDPDMVNQESEKIQSVTAEGVQRMAQEVLTPDNCSTVFYHAE
ncbi:MAG: pitrilysin family protein [Tunicatimonas sp.]